MEQNFEQNKTQELQKFYTLGRTIEKTYGRKRHLYLRYSEYGKNKYELYFGYDDKSFWTGHTKVTFHIILAVNSDKENNIFEVKGAEVLYIKKLSLEYKDIIKKFFAETFPNIKVNEIDQTWDFYNGDKFNKCHLPLLQDYQVQLKLGSDHHNLVDKKLQWFCY